MNDHVLVLGAGGFMGQHLARAGEARSEGYCRQSSRHQLW